MDTVPRWVNAANLLTLLRLGLVPFAVSAILAGQHGRALSLVLIAGLTDTIDGTLARHFGMATTVGAFILAIGVILCCPETRGTEIS